MAGDPKKIITELLNKIEGSITTFENATPKIESRIMSRFQGMMSDLDTLKDGTIKPTVANLRKVNAFSKEMRREISASGWDKTVNGIDKDLKSIEGLQYQYFDTVSKGYAAGAFMNSLKETTMQQVSKDLLESGLSANVVDKASTIIQRNITEKASLSDLVQEMSTFIQGNEQRLGVLSRYSRQIVTDSLNQYAAQLNKTFTDDLGLQWYRYVGSLVNDSRPWCIAMVSKEWIHESELPAVTRGRIDGETVSLAGLMPGTNATNVQVRRGGYNCNHMLLPVATEAVPKDLRNKLNQNIITTESEEEIDFDEIRKQTGSNLTDEEIIYFRENQGDFDQIHWTKWRDDESMRKLIADHKAKKIAPPVIKKTGFAAKSTEELVDLRAKYSAQLGTKQEDVNTKLILNNIDKELDSRVKYTPLKSTKEVNEYLRGFTHHGGGVDISGFNKNGANIYARQYTKLNEQYPVVKIDAIKRSSASTWGGQAHGGSINMSSTVFNKWDKVYEYNQKHPTLGRYTRDIVSNSIKNPEDAFINNITHEYGHIIADQTFGQINGRMKMNRFIRSYDRTYGIKLSFDRAQDMIVSGHEDYQLYLRAFNQTPADDAILTGYAKNRVFVDKWKSLWARMSADDIATKQMSKYAFYDPGEFFAESFTMYMNPAEVGNLPLEVRNLMTETLNLMK